MSVIHVPLRRRDGSLRAVAVVDAADAERVEPYRWHIDDSGYPARHAKIDGKWTKVRLHRHLLELAPGDPREGDHRNLDRLDNRRSNLRVCTHAQNQQNRTANRGSSSRYRGVTWDKSRQKWKAQAMVGGRNHHLGDFSSEEAAGAAAAAFRAEHMPFSVEAA